MLISATVVVGMPRHAAARQVLRLGGTGSANELLKVLGHAYQQSSTEVEPVVIPGLGSGGGIQAARDNAIDVAVSTRLLKPEEAVDMTAVPFIRSAYVMATSHLKPNPITSSDVAHMLVDPQAKWQDGTPVRVILRPRNETDNALIASLFPGAGSAIETARKRTELPIAVNDQENATMAESIPGSLVGMSLLQLHLEKRNLRALSIDGKQASLANLESGAYPFTRDFFLVTPTKPSPVVEKFIAFVRSADGAKVLRDCGVKPLI